MSYEHSLGSYLTPLAILNISCSCTLTGNMSPVIKEHIISCLSALEEGKTPTKITWGTDNTGVREDPD